MACVFDKEKLLRYFQKTGLTIKDTARYMGITDTNLNNLLYRKNGNPTLETLVKITNFYGIPIEDLIIRDSSFPYEASDACGNDSFENHCEIFDEIKALKEEVKNLKSQISSNNRKINTLKEKLDTRNDRIKRRDREIEELKAKLAQKKEEIVFLKSQFEIASIKIPRRKRIPALTGKESNTYETLKVCERLDSLSLDESLQYWSKVYYGDNITSQRKLFFTVLYKNFQIDFDDGLSFSEKNFLEDSLEKCDIFLTEINEERVKHDNLFLKQQAVTLERVKNRIHEILEGE